METIISDGDDQRSDSVGASRPGAFNDAAATIGDDDVVNVDVRPPPHEDEEAAPLSITERLLVTILRLPRSQTNEQLLESVLDIILRHQSQKEPTPQPSSESPPSDEGMHVGESGLGATTSTANTTTTMTTTTTTTTPHQNLPSEPNIPRPPDSSGRAHRPTAAQDEQEIRRMTSIMQRASDDMVLSQDVQQQESISDLHCRLDTTTDRMGKSEAAQGQDDTPRGGGRDGVDDDQSAAAEREDDDREEEEEASAALGMQGSTINAHFANKSDGDEENGDNELHQRIGDDFNWLVLDDVDEELSRQFRHLRNALEAGHPHSSLSSVQEIVEAHPRVMAVKGWGANHMTLVHWAACAELTTQDTLKYLVDKNPRALKVRAHNGRMPLHMAATLASFETVFVLADAYPEALLIKTMDGTPLHLAAIGDAENEREPLQDVVVYLAAKEPRALMEADYAGQLPLHGAARRGAPLRIIRFLTTVYPGAVHARTVDGELPLHCAALFSRVEVVQLLVELDPAAVRATTSHGLLALHCAAKSNERIVVRFLVEQEPSGLQAKTNEGFLPLHMAASGYEIEVVQYLVEQDPTGLQARTNEGFLPLHIAAQGFLAEVVHYLVEHNPAGLQATTNEGFLPLHIAVRGFCADVVRFLVERNPAGAQAMTNDGSLALHFAAEKGKPESVQLLADAYPQALQRKNKEGFLPLHIAARVDDNNPFNNNRLSTIYILARMWPGAITRAASRIRGSAPQP